MQIARALDVVVTLIAFEVAPFFIMIDAHLLADILDVAHAGTRAFGSTVFAFAARHV